MSKSEIAQHNGVKRGQRRWGRDNPDISVKEILTLTAANPRWRVTFRRLSIVSILKENSDSVASIEARAAAGNAFTHDPPGD